jgi:hypothetical protein
MGLQDEGKISINRIDEYEDFVNFMKKEFNKNQFEIANEASYEFYNYYR